MHKLGWFPRGYTSQLQALIEEPDTQALLAAAPRAVSILRPLCRILGLRVPSIPDLPRAPRKRAPKAKRPRKPTRRELEQILWYPNSEGRPMKLLPPRKKRA
jgi:hypothetical protein